MENQMQVVALPKKLWKVLRVFFYMVRKGISKRKLLLHLNLLLKRGKLAGKALTSLMTPFPNHHHRDSSPHPTADLFLGQTPLKEYEFSCSNTPAHHKFMFYKRKQQAHLKAHYETVEEEVVNMMALNDVVGAAYSSPMLPGLGLGQLRVMDSPVSNSSHWDGDEGDCHVDEAAEEFIMRFFSQLRRQALTDA